MEESMKVFSFLVLPMGQRIYFFFFLCYSIQEQNSLFARS